MAQIISTEPSDLQIAAEVLRSGKLAALPTETVYGLAADATNGNAVAGIFSAKGRPHFNPLIAHMATLAMAERYVQFDDISRKLATKFWPGPLTLVLPVRDGAEIHPLVTAGLTTLAIRMPRGPVREIIAMLDRPLAAPSANSSGRISATSAQAVQDDLGAKLDLIVDGGACVVGLESTIVKIENGQAFLLRPGGLAAEEIEAFLGQPLHRLDQRAAIQAPGMMASHYAPDAVMRLNISEVREGEALLAFGAQRATGADKAAAVLNLSPSGDLHEAAVHLFDYMKKLDAAGAKTIAVEPIPHHGLGEAINDRLSRAAAPRE
ncbi:L-threonylcarbamoyladenylate synthase [Pseudochrobactrum sp. sp1633]|uniref:L-threonylcarbamoyladenylate synthase n=1 Tax=Pseudochrobactrum sp. sp1633 TaxID=3036706 RepID=UPI0025A56954|nr:L-threonylcarbamoyladenylate synthase [Pseudochrobactrum sp. sp1633]MDM8345300.1 L-threonylcarbamoyladenylate synthase [Pseudochrobactrum sp. sp1633]HWD12849.1 L-threonylcarbamoyladenylate synthase [Pseudochrobactrum sp.]